MSSLAYKKSGCRIINLSPAHKIIKAEAGATINHNIIVGNLVTIISEYFKRECCFNTNAHTIEQVSVCQTCVNVFPSDVYLSVDGTYCLPDIVIVEGNVEQRRAGGKRKIKHVINPKIIIEVFSQGNTNAEMMQKLDSFKKLDSFDTLFIVDSRCQEKIEAYSRKDDWAKKEFDDLTLSLQRGILTISSKEIYFKYGKLAE